jgi:P4 family phage/plasmid primase-like protien
MSNYYNLTDFLRKHSVKKDDTKEITHTRIGNTELNIYGGKYHIPQEELPLFYKLYHQHVFINKENEYLTEVQNKDGNSQILIDLDFRYDTSINKRLHSDEHIDDILELYMETINKMLVFENQTLVPIYVFERDDVNITQDCTKDGIHIIIGLKMDHAGQMLLRDKILKEIANVLGDLPLKNDYESVLDTTITQGSTNWQMYGSCKPGNKPYKLKHKYTYTYCDDEDTFDIEKETIHQPKHLELLPIISAQYKKMTSVEYNENTKQDVLSYASKTSKTKKTTKKYNTKQNTIISYNNLDYSTLKNVEELEAITEGIFENLPHEKYYYRETFRFLMSLPKKYYEEYLNWLKCGWALHNLDACMFIPWMLFSSQWKDFNFDDIEGYNDLWLKMKDEGLTHRSIMYWSKQDNPNEFNRIRTETIEYYMEISVKSSQITESDVAQVLYQLYKDEFRCASIKNRTWYHFKNHRWNEIDLGTTLRYNISRVLSKMYADKGDDLTRNLYEAPQAQDEEAVKKFARIKALAGRYSEVSTELKKTSMKQNVMKEVAEIFYDEDKTFIDRLDKNPYLLCFTNGVYDFKEGIFRSGMPDDYISLSTNIPYIPFDSNNETHVERKEEIEDFFRKLFPIEELYNYMWEHLASTLIGINKNQTFNIYNGVGRNGKSTLIDLMTAVLGDYICEIPITLVTQKRNSIGSASPEIANLKGKRYAIMNEPSKGERLNDGIMKQLTGGDSLTGRPMYKEPVTFKPAFKLAVCTNNLFDIKSNDDGTWRRIRLCEFLSKFVKDAKPTTENPYEYEIDFDINKKFESWKYVFMSMLVDIAYKTQSVVTDCDMVLKASNKYRGEQDHIMEFYIEKIVKGDQTSIIKRTEVYQEFKTWYEVMYGKGVPKGKELYDFLDSKIGNYNCGWHGYKIKYEFDNEGGATLNDEY